MSTTKVSATASPAIRSAVSGKLADGRAVSYAFAPDAFEEYCRRAAIIVATRNAPPDCDATVIGRKQWREQGALALYRDRNGSGFTIDQRGHSITIGRGRRVRACRGKREQPRNVRQRHRSAARTFPAAA